MTNLIYNFIDEAHKRMHNVLFQAGWNCENDAVLSEINCFRYNWRYSKDNLIIYFDNSWDKIGCNYNMNKCYKLLDNKKFSEVADIIEAELKQPKDFSHIKVGQWVRFIDSNNDRFSGETFNKWYQRLEAAHDFYEDKGSLYFYYEDDTGCCGYSDAPEDWDLTDIRDTKPDQHVQPNEMVDQPVETHEEIEYHPITKDNIVEVLEYNGFDNYGQYYRIYEHYIIWHYNKDDVSEEDSKQVIIYFNNNKWLEHLELETGKLNPIPKPKFDFVQYLLDNEAKIHVVEDGNTFMGIGLIDFVVTNRVFQINYDQDQSFKLTKENADKLIAMAKLSEQLS